jgi:hypothetical protein
MFGTNYLSTTSITPTYFKGTGGCFQCCKPVYSRSYVLKRAPCVQSVVHLHNLMPKHRDGRQSVHNWVVVWKHRRWQHRLLPSSQRLTPFYRQRQPIWPRIISSSVYSIRHYGIQEIKSIVFWNATPCSLVEFYRCFRGTTVDFFKEKSMPSKANSMHLDICYFLIPITLQSWRQRQ